MAKTRWNTSQIKDQTGRVAIVTGANSGIGYEAAKTLAEKGAHVVVATRSPERGESAVRALRDSGARGPVELMLLDVANLESVRQFAASFTDRFDRLDLLINNAGVMMPPERQETKDGFELQFGTNHLGHLALTLQLLPLIVRTEGSRVVNVSSSAQNFSRLDLDDLQWTKRPFDRMGSYGASKMANMLFTVELQRRLEEAGASTLAAACHPGWTGTNLQRTSTLFRWFNPLFGMKPWQGALPTLYAAVSDDVEGARYYGPDGLGNMRGYPTLNQPAEGSTKADDARRLWTLSEKLVGITAPALAASGETVGSATAV